MAESMLLAISPLDGRYANKVETLQPLTSEYGLIYFRVLVEVRWLITLAQQLDDIPSLSKEQQQFIQNIIDQFDLQDAEAIKKIEATTNHDVKAVEYFIAEKISQRQDLKGLQPFIHFACTSEDINNVAYALMLQHARKTCLLPALQTIEQTLVTQAKQYAEIPMLARTHGQHATPTTLGKELANVAARLQRQIEQLENQVILAKFNGAVGNYNAHLCAYPEINWPSFNARFIEGLGLEFNSYTTQIEPHDAIAEYLHILSRSNTILLDLARDIWGYISIGYFSQLTQAQEVGSSTMPHKVNPIDFENAEGNLGIAISLCQQLANKLPISRWQRDLSDSTTLRNLGSVFGYSLLAYQSLSKGLSKIEANKTQIAADLTHCWEVLAEPIQTIMRRHGINDAYEQLKALTRGKAITKESIGEFIDQLELPQKTKKQLAELTPSNYTGYAVSLTEKIGDNKP